MSRLYKAAVLVAFVLEVLFLFGFLTSLCGCVSAAHQYVRSQYPPECKTSALEETSKTAIILVECPEEDPITEKVRKR